MEWEGLGIVILNSVYEPADDSFLLAKYAKGLAEKLGKTGRGTRNGPRILEVGCGSGIVSLACAKTNPKGHVLGVDINPEAVENSKDNAKRNGIKNAEFLESDLFSRVSGKFDLIFFNPPYLPTSQSEKVKGKLNCAFDGGKNGRRTTDRFLREFPIFLKRWGKLVMIESSLAGIEKTIAKVGKLGFRARVLEEEKFFFEKIAAILIERA